MHLVELIIKQEKRVNVEIILNITFISKEKESVLGYSKKI